MLLPSCFSCAAWGDAHEYRDGLLDILRSDRLRPSGAYLSLAFVVKTPGLKSHRWIEYEHPGTACRIACLSKLFFSEIGGFCSHVGGVLRLSRYFGKLAVRGWIQDLQRALVYGHGSIGLWIRRELWR